MANYENTNAEKEIDFPHIARLLYDYSEEFFRLLNNTYHEVEFKGFLAKHCDGKESLIVKLFRKSDDEFKRSFYDIHTPIERLILLGCAKPKIGRRPGHRFHCIQRDGMHFPLTSADLNSTRQSLLRMYFKRKELPHNSFGLYCSTKLPNLRDLNYKGLVNHLRDKMVHLGHEELVCHLCGKDLLLNKKLVIHLCAALDIDHTLVYEDEALVHDLRNILRYLREYIITSYCTPQKIVTNFVARWSPDPLVKYANHLVDFVRLLHNHYPNDETWKSLSAEYLNAEYLTFKTAYPRDPAYFELCSDIKEHVIPTGSICLICEKEFKGKKDAGEDVQGQFIKLRVVKFFCCDDTFYHSNCILPWLRKTRYCFKCHTELPSTEKEYKLYTNEQEKKLKALEMDSSMYS